MSIYYILATIDEEDVVYMLDATESVEHTLPGQSTNYAIEDGSDISDNIALRPRTISFSGVISDIKTRSSSAYLNSHDYIQALEDLRGNKELFSIYYTADHPPLLNVFFESLKISQDNTNGTLITPERESYGVSSFKVSFTVKEFRISTRAAVSKVRSDELNIVTKSDSSATTASEDGTKPSKSVGHTLLDDGTALTKSITG